MRARPVGKASVAFGLRAGVLASVLPYAADLTALRLVPSRFFAVFMSVHPVVAALVGTVLLGQILVVHQWVGISIIVAANAAAVLSSSGPPRPFTGDAASTGQAAPAEAVTA